MFKKLNNTSLKIIAPTLAFLFSLTAKAQEGGFVDMENRVKQQGNALLGTGLVIAFLIGVGLTAYGVLGLRKLGRAQLQDEDKWKVWSSIIVGPLLIVFPAVLAFTMGVIGTTETASSVGNPDDWGL